MEVQEVQFANYLAFLSILPTSSGNGFIGAVLVLDHKGIPIEFRCTEPVRFSELQRMLYGASFESYIGVTLCGLPLLKALEATPNLIVVNKEFLLEIQNEIKKSVVLVMQSDGFKNNIRFSEHDLSKWEMAKPDGDNNRPVICCCYSRSYEEVQKIVGPTRTTYLIIDLLEPFERIELAMRMLEKQDERYR